ESAEQRHRHLGPDPAGGVEDAEHVAIALFGEPVEADVVLPDVGVGVDDDLLPHSRQGDDVPGRHLDLVADTTDLDAEAGVAHRDQDAPETPDHREAPMGAVRRWQRAMARASAASAGDGGLASLRRRATITWTWAFPADPSPVTADFTAVGTYSETGTPARAAARSTTPEARPTDMAVCRLRLVKRVSMATASGLVSSNSPASPSCNSSSLFGVSRSGSVRMTPARIARGG